MKITEFVTKYNNFANKDAKENLLKGIIKKEVRLPFTTKKALAQAIAKASCTDKNGNFKIDSLKHYYMFMFEIINDLTNLEFTQGNESIEFDLLDENGLLDEIAQLVDQKTFKDLESMSKIATEDYIQTHMQFQNWVESLLNSNLSSFLEQLRNVVENLDDDKLNKIIDFTKAKGIMNN